MKIAISSIACLLAQNVIATGSSIGSSIPPPNDNKSDILSPTASHLPGPPIFRDVDGQAMNLDALQNDALDLDTAIAKVTTATSSSSDNDHHQHLRYPGLWFTKYIWYKDPQSLCNFADDNHNFTATSAANPDHCEFLYQFFDGTTGAREVSEWEGGYNHDQDWVVGYIDCKFWVRRKDGMKGDVQFGNIDMRDRLRYALDNYIVDYGSTIGKRVGAMGRGNCHEPEEADIEWMVYS